jgi:Tfp pilus assembly protein PilX
MKVKNTTRKRQPQAGVALLISIFVLLLISVVAIALIVSSGTESALAGNYRNATAVYYAALAGLEEGRGRLLAKNTNSFKNTAAPTFMPPGTTLAIGSPRYIINPVGSETVAPWDQSNQYADTEYTTEFGANPPGSSPSTPSLSTVAGIQGPTFKWVRINAVSSASLGLAVGPSYSGPPYDSTTPVFYDSTQPSGAQLNITPTGAQVLELTSFAVLPNGSQKILQYLVVPSAITVPTFPAALTFASDTGHTVWFTAPQGNGSYYVSGNDIAVPQLPSCTPGSAVHAITTYHTNAKNDVIVGYAGFPSHGIPSGQQPLYTGQSPAPDVQLDPSSNPANYQTPAQVDGIVQNILQNAAPIVLTPGSGTTPPYTSFDYDLHAVTTGMSATNPLTIVVNGNLDISNWGGDGYGQGYGLLVVTGNFSYDPDTTWNGIILVIGQGFVNNSQHGGSGVINGAMFVSQTRGPGPSFSLLPNLGTATVKFDSTMQGIGMRYSSCWIQNSIPTGSYKVLSFHEIAQP